MRIKVISRTGGNALIEWVEDGNYHRSIVPADTVQDGECEHPERGIPYGEDWADRAGQLDMARLANELRRRGIWTVEDLQQRHRDAMGAVLAAAGNVLSGIVSESRAQQRANQEVLQDG